MILHHVDNIKNFVRCIGTDKLFTILTIKRTGCTLFILIVRNKFRLCLLRSPRGCYEATKICT